MMNLNLWIRISIEAKNMKLIKTMMIWPGDLIMDLIIMERTSIMKMEALKIIKVL